MMVSPEPTEEDYRALFVKPDLEVRDKGEVLGVLTGQVPVRSMPVAMNEGDPDEEPDTDERDA